MGPARAGGAGVRAARAAGVLLAAFWWAGVLGGCASARVARARAEVLRLHAAERRAHLERNPAALVALLADDFVQVQSGEVSRPTRAERLERFGQYFGSVEFLAWDDLAPPEVILSADATLAVVTVRKQVTLVPAGAGADAVPETTVFAWSETLARRVGGWRVIAITSTRKELDAAAVLAAGRRALGDEARVAAVRSVHAVARATAPRGTYVLEVDAARGPRVAWTNRRGGEVLSSAVVRGAEGWSVERDGRVERLEPAEVAVVRGHAFQMMALAPEEFFRELVIEGHEAFAGRSCYRLRGRDGAGQPARLFFDVEGGRLVGLRLVDARKGQGVEISFDAWREVEGVRLPGRVTARDPSGVFVLDFVELALDGVPEERFVVPDGAAGRRSPS
ncbi:MAG TPA: DUF4440 domain-containing protein [Polyangia bacterium]|jgi:hypothetical protein|nr:DUF4440 domain-containing protein [Polyangia bacterium]